MSDLASAKGRRLETRLAAGDLVPSERRTRWRGWYGGVAMLVVCLAPFALLVVRRPRSLDLHLGPNFAFDVGQLIAALPSVAAVVLLAPLVGYRRRDAVLMTIPVANIYVAWIVGARAVQLRAGDAPQSWTGSHEGNRVAELLCYLAVAAYVAWMIVVFVLAAP